MKTKIEHNRSDDVNVLNELRLSIESDPSIAYNCKCEICKSINDLVGLLVKHYNIKNI